MRLVTGTLLCLPRCPVVDQIRSDKQREWRTPCVLIFCLLLLSVFLSRRESLFAGTVRRILSFTPDVVFPFGHSLLVVEDGSLLFLQLFPRFSPRCGRSVRLLQDDRPLPFYLVGLFSSLVLGWHLRASENCLYALVFWRWPLWYYRLLGVWRCSAPSSCFAPVLVTGVIVADSIGRRELLCDGSPEGSPLSSTLDRFPTYLTSACLKGRNFALTNGSFEDSQNWSSVNAVASRKLSLGRQLIGTLPVQRGILPNCLPHVVKRPLELVKSLTNKLATIGPAERGIATLL